MTDVTSPTIIKVPLPAVPAIAVAHHVSLLHSLFNKVDNVIRSHVHRATHLTVEQGHEAALYAWLEPEIKSHLSDVFATVLKHLEEEASKEAPAVKSVAPEVGHGSI
jgi:hypothetical protein